MVTATGGLRHRTWQGIGPREVRAGLQGTTRRVRVAALPTEVRAAHSLEPPTCT